MGFWARLKRLWDLTSETKEVTPVTTQSGEETIVKAVFGENAVFGKPIGMATIVQDDPIDMFKEEEHD